MAALAVDLQVLLARGDILGHRFGEIQFLAVLFDTRHLQSCAVAHAAFARLQLAEEQLKQRGLAGAVRTNDTYFIPAADDQREVVHQRLVAVTEFEVADFEHQIARALGLLYAQSGDAMALAPLATLLPQFLQCARTAFVSGAAGLDALTDPDLFL